jgi:hypothetical protein
LSSLIPERRESPSGSTKTSSTGFATRVNAAGGGNYQTLINKALREYIGTRTEPLEKTIRRVIREELRKKGAA